MIAPALSQNPKAHHYYGVDPEDPRAVSLSRALGMTGPDVHLITRHRQYFNGPDDGEVALARSEQHVRELLGEVHDRVDEGEIRSLIPLAALALIHPPGIATPKPVRVEQAQEQLASRVTYLRHVHEAKY